jgi:ribonuclease I
MVRRRAAPQHRYAAPLYVHDPSARTLEHEWLKHGTCAAKTPEAYFGTAQRLWQGQMPAMGRLGAAPRRAICAMPLWPPIRGLIAARWG